MGFGTCIGPIWDYFPKQLFLGILLCHFIQHKYKQTSKLALKSGQVIKTSSSYVNNNYTTGVPVSAILRSFSAALNGISL